MDHVDRIPMLFPGNEPLEARQKCPEKRSLEGGSRHQPVSEPSAHFPMEMEKRWDFKGVGSQLGSNPSQMDENVSNSSWEKEENS